MALADKQSPVTMQELLVSTLAQSGALAKLLIDKGIITQAEFMEKISAERRRINECSIQQCSDLWNFLPS